MVAAAAIKVVYCGDQFWNLGLHDTGPLASLGFQNLSKHSPCEVLVQDFLAEGEEVSKKSARYFIRHLTVRPRTSYQIHIFNPS